MTHTATRYLAAIARTLGSLLPGRQPSPHQKPRTLVQPSRQDTQQSYPTAGLTPARLRAFLQAADHGNPQIQFELFHEMLQKWPRLAAVEQTRRLALTGLDWEIIPDPNAKQHQRKIAADAAKYCHETLRNTTGFTQTLDHLANAIGFGLALAELVWDRGKLVETIPVPYNRLHTDPNHPWLLRLRTTENPAEGLALEDFPNKWINHQPRPALGKHFQGGLLRTSVLLYLAQNLSFKDWLIFSQIAGMPVRVARFEPGTPEADKQQLMRMLQSLGTDAVAAFSNNIDLQFIETRAGAANTYPPLQDYCNTEVTILWLGQHLTTDLRNTGSRAAAEIHDRVREDLLVHDINAESRTLRRDLLTPLARARFGHDVPIPRFQRSLVQAVDTQVLAHTLAVAVNDLRLDVPREWVHQSLGIPLAAPDEPTLPKGARK